MQTLIDSLTEQRVLTERLSQVAMDAFNALGGRRAAMMLGAKSIVDLSKGGSPSGKKLKGVGIKWPNRSRSKGNYVELYVNPRDEYVMDFYNLGRGKAKKVKSYGNASQGLPLENIRSVFEKQTGWYLSM